ncbi:hypothetical protein TSMEX_006788, partial [Taenia solium]
MASFGVRGVFLWAGNANRWRNPQPLSIVLSRKVSLL